MPSTKFRSGKRTDRREDLQITDVRISDDRMVCSEKQGQWYFGFGSPAIHSKPPVEAALRCYRVYYTYVIARNEAIST